MKSDLETKTLNLRIQNKPRWDQTVISPFHLTIIKFSMKFDQVKE